MEVSKYAEHGNGGRSVIFGEEANSSEGVLHLPFSYYLPMVTSSAEKMAEIEGEMVVVD